MATDAILTLDEVVAGYGKMTILHGTTCSVARGAITTVIGPNGAGKSTMFKTVFGMLPARSGRIMFEGAEITNLAPRDLLARGISYVPQGRNIFPGALGAPQSRARRRDGAGGLRSRGRMDAAMDALPGAAPQGGQRRPPRSPAASRRCWRSRARCCSSRS